MTNPSSPDTDEIAKLAGKCGICFDHERWGTTLTRMDRLIAFYNAARSQGVIAGMEEASDIASERYSHSGAVAAINERIAALADKG
jgi:hypothetical protein